MQASFGPYELLRKVAAGGMAEIYLARQWGEAGFSKDIVIKRLFSHLAEYDQAVRMFQYEALLLSELCHPNIPQVSHLGCFDGTWFVAMEYVDGLNVADLWRIGMRAGVVLPLAVALGVVAQAAEGLHHAHERHDRAGNWLRIVHRDVTPQNVMLTRDGVVKLLDFGVAQTAARADTDQGVARGTYSYMAPEQVRGRPLDRRADVFALGVVLYELTTGTRLYRGSDVAVMTAIVERDAPPPSSRVPGYPDDLEGIVMRALARDVDQRTSSAAELAQELAVFALARGLLVGPRAIAEYVRAVSPVERLPDGPSVGQRDDEEIFSQWPPGLDAADDVSPGAFRAFDEVTQDSPVVLLDSPKRPPPSDDYVRALERRLGNDDET